MVEQEVSLRDYIKVVKKRKKLILLLFFMAVIASAVISFLLQPVYEVGLAMKIGSIIDVDTLEKDFIESPIAASEFLEGPQVLIEVVKELKLSYSPTEFRKKVSVEPIRETEDLIWIKVNVNKPEEAVNIANHLANRLLERHEEIKRLYESKGEILAKYDEQIGQINEELVEIDRSKDEILAKYDENIKGIDNQLVLMEKEINKAKEEMARLEVSLEVLSEEAENKMADSGSLSDADASMIIGRLDDMRSGWGNYRTNISEKQQQYNDVLEKLRETQLKKTEFGESKQERYSTLTTELRKVQMEKTKFERIASVKMYNTEILVAAEKPQTPIKPNKLLNVLVAAVVGLIVGLGLAFSLEYFEKIE